MQTVETGRLRMAWRTWGDEGGVPILLLHGSFATSRWWELLAEVMPSEYRLIAPDLRGGGGTEKPGTGYTIHSQTDDISAFIRALKLPRATIVVHGSASSIALEYALDHPDGVERLILIAPPPLEGIVTPPEAITALEAMRTEPHLLRRGLVLMAPAAAVESPDLFAVLEQDAAAMDPAAFRGNADALAQWNRSADGRLLTIPTLIIWGDRDPIVERSAVMRLLVSLPGAESMEILHGVGHSPMLDDPLQLAERIVDFITGDDGTFASVRASV